MPRQVFVFFLLAQVLGLFAVAQVLPTAKPWKAQWIASPDAPQRDEVVLHFRKVVEISRVPPHFYLDVSADNQFLFHVNRQRVGTGPSRSDLAHWKYEIYDISSFLHPGKNILAATVWNFGTHAAVAQISDRIAFLVHGGGDAEQIANTNETWEVERESGIRTLPFPLRNFYFAAEPGLHVDGNKFDANWDGDPEQESRWAKVVTLGRGSWKGESDPPNNWQLLPDLLPPMEMRPVPAGKLVRAVGVSPDGNFPGVPLAVPAHSKASVLIDNSTLTTGYSDIAVSKGAGATIRLTYAEALYDASGQKGNRSEITGKHIEGVFDELLVGNSGSQTFMPLTWRTWRYLQLDIDTADQPLTIDRFQAWFSAYPFEERAYFSSDDTSLKSIWDIGWRTARLDAHDTYMDTPYWERSQYIGDTRIQALISYAVAGDDRLARQAIDAFNNSRVTEGLTQSRYPSALLQMIPTFSLLWVDMVHDFWMYRDDPKFVRSQLPGTRAVLAWYLRNQRADGLMGKIPWWPFVDWGSDFSGGVPPQQPDGGSSVITLQFVEALRNAAEIEEKLGDQRLATDYRAAADHASSAVVNACWNQQYGLLADDPSQQHFSQHANILGVWLDVIPRDAQRRVLEDILSTTDSGFSAHSPLPPMTAATYYFRFYLARAVLHAGMGERYLDLLTPWRQMMSLGLTTWAEQPEPTRSDSHAWSAHPNFDFLTIVAGVRPVSPGFKSVAIEPHLGILKNVEADMPTAAGMISVKYTHLRTGLHAEITLPENTSGRVEWHGHSAVLHAGKQEIEF